MSQVSTLPKLDSTYAISAQQQAEYPIDSPLNPLI